MNFLLITSDQQRWDTLGAVNPVMQTPNLDRLAGRGILFERAYTVNPVCTPSRVSILTGHYPSRHGCFHVGTALPLDYPTLAQRMSEAGYYTAILGKAHFLPCRDPNSFESAPFIHQHDFFRRWSGPYFGFQHARLVIGHTSEPHGCGMHYGVWLKDQGVDLQRYFDIHDYTHFGAWELPEHLHGSHWTADETIDAIDQAQKQGKPFFLWSSFQDPHNPYIAPEPWASMIQPEKMAKPLGNGHPPTDKPPFYASLQSGTFYGDDPDLSRRGWGDCRIQPELTADDISRLRGVYSGMVSLMDHHIGRILEALEQRGLLQDTVIVFTSDHGDYLGDYSLWGKGLPTYESMQRIPFVVAHPHCSTAGHKSQALQSLVDIEATICDIAGVQAHEHSQGMSQQSAWLDATRSIRQRALIEFRPSQGPYKQHTWITDRYKYVRYRQRDYGELYDLEKDPHQLHNLFDEPEAISVRRQFDSECRIAKKDEQVRERTAIA